MIRFYRNSTDQFTRWVEEKLNEMVVAHKLIKVDESHSLPKGISLQDLPVLTDGHEKCSSREEIKAFLRELHQDLQLSRSMQSDACYLDPDNPEECL